MISKSASASQFVQLVLLICRHETSHFLAFSLSFEPRIRPKAADNGSLSDLRYILTSCRELIQSSVPGRTRHYARLVVRISSVWPLTYTVRFLSVLMSSVGCHFSSCSTFLLGSALADGAERVQDMVLRATAPQGPGVSHTCMSRNDVSGVLYYSPLLFRAFLYFHICLVMKVSVHDGV